MRSFRQYYKDGCISHCTARLIHLLLLEWQGISCLRLFSSICRVWLKEPSNSWTVTLMGPCRNQRNTLQVPLKNTCRPPWPEDHHESGLPHTSGLLPRIFVCRMRYNPGGFPAPEHSSSCWRQSCHRTSPPHSDLWVRRSRQELKALTQSSITCSLQP